MPLPDRCPPIAPSGAPLTVLPSWVGIPETDGLRPTYWKVTQRTSSLSAAATPHCCCCCYPNLARSPFLLWWSLRLLSSFRQVLLGVLPLDPSCWADTMERNRSLYDTYVEELMDAPARQRAESEVDDPLSGSENSAWNA